MRTLLILSILAACTAVASATDKADKTSSPQLAAAGTADFKAHVLSRAELDKLLAHPERVLVIDVRRPDEVTAIGGLPVFLSVQVSDLEKRLAWIPKDRSIITVSNHAKRAGKAADLLASKGFDVAGAVGVQTYEEQGGTLTKLAIPHPHPGLAPAQASSR